MLLRPQMRQSIHDNLLVGVAVSVLVNKNEERLGSFVRLIYEPGHRH